MIGKCGAAALLALVTMASVALGNDSENGLEEIVVTATKRAESIQEIPIAVTSLSSATIETGIVDDIAEASRLVPNLKLNHGRDSASQAAIHVRGVGQSDEHGDPGVGIYVDGVYMARSYGSLLGLLDLERVEVLRGPQGTLYGRNTIGGAINLVTRKPDGDQELKVDLGYGSFDAVFVRASGQTELIEDKAFSRASVVYQNDSGYTKNLANGEKLNNRSSIAFRLANRLLVSDRFEINATFDLIDDESNAPASFISAVDPNNGTYQFLESTLGPIGDYLIGGPAGVSVDRRPRRVNLDSSNDQDLEAWGGTVSSRISFDAVEFLSITAYREIDNQINSDIDGTPSLILDQRSTFSNSQFSQEFQFSGVGLDGRGKWVAGLYYFDEEQALPIAVEIIPDLAPLLGANIGFVRNVERTAESWAAFGSVDYDLTDALMLTVGARYTEEKKTLMALRQTFSGDVTFSEPGTSDTFSSFSPKVSLSYSFSDQSLGYASYSKGFKSGGYNSRAASGGQTQSFEPEELNSFELGFKSRFAEDRVQLNVAAFYSDYSDIQQQIFTTDSTGSIVSTVTNAAEATVKGLEVELVASPTANLLVNASIGLIDSEFDEFEDVLLGDLSGRKFQDTPEFSLHVGAEYTFQLPDGYSLRLATDYSYQSKVYYDPLNAEQIAENGYSLLNARVALLSSDGKYEVSVFAKNLTDELYKTSGVNLLGADDFGYGLNYYGQPRVWGIRLGIKV